MAQLEIMKIALETTNNIKEISAKFYEFWRPIVKVMNFFKWTALTWLSKPVLSQCLQETHISVHNLSIYNYKLSTYAYKLSMYVCLSLYVTMSIQLPFIILSFRYFISVHHISKCNPFTKVLTSIHT